MLQASVNGGSRVLYGDMHVRAFDWAEPAPGGDPWAPRRAALVADRIIHVRSGAEGLGRRCSSLVA